MPVRPYHLLFIFILTAGALQFAIGQSPALGAKNPGIKTAVAPGDEGRSSDNASKLLLGHNLSPDQEGVIEIKYALKIRGDVLLQILDPAGHPLRTLVEGFKERGSYTFQLRPSALFLAPGNYLLRLESNGNLLIRPIQW